MKDVINRRGALIGIGSAAVLTAVPINAFAAVAEILTYVYRANGNVPNLMKEKLHEDTHIDPQNPKNNNSYEPKETS